MRFRTNFWLVIIALAIGLLLPMFVFAMASHSTSDVLYFGTTNVVANSSSKLTRNNNGISMNLKTTDLDAGGAYTIWWVIFNNPEYCSDECGENDLPPLNPKANPLVNASVAFAAGHVVGNNGKGNFGGHLSVGDTSGLHPAFTMTNGLVDSHGAEIHLIVRSHGQPIPGQVSEQISTFLGGCNINACVDQQAAIHLP